jgi:hypothetical protein
MGDFTLNELLREIRQTNLCTYYLLPLTGLTRLSFGEGLFLNSYLETDRYWIIVQVPDLHLVPIRIRSHTVKLWENDEGGFLAYAFSDEWRADVDLFVKGRYSAFSEVLKKVIFDRSGLRYREPVSYDKIYTDIRLLALDGKEAVRQYLEEELQVDLEPGQEVLPPPPVTSFMKVEER